MRPLYSFAALAVGALLVPPAAAAAAGPQALFARERAAVGGAAWNRVGALRSAGTVVTGGATSTFTQILDHRSGWTKSTTIDGPVTDVSGYDGVAWDFQGGAVTEQTLPGLRADNVTQAYVARDGWWNAGDRATMAPLGTQAGMNGVRVVPAGGSPIDVWFDARTGLIGRTVAHTDYGNVVTVLDDYRADGDVVIPFREVSTDAAGAVTTVTDRVMVPLPGVPATAFARPAPVSSGRVAGPPPATAPFRLTGSPAILVRVRFHGGSVPLIFDSGAGNYMVPAAAKQLALRSAGGVPMEGVGNGSISAGLASVGTIALGSAQLVDQHFVIAPLPYPFIHEQRGVAAYGLVGSEFLQSFRTTFDFTRHRIQFSPFAQPAAAPAGAVVLPMLSDGAHAYVRASVNGAAGIFLLDTGDNGNLTIFPWFATAHHLLHGPGVHYLAIGGVGGHLALARYRVGSFSLGGGTIHSVPTTLAQASAGAFASKSVAGNIGLQIISRYRVTFDFRRATVTFVPTAAIDAPFRVDRSGLSLNQTDGTAFEVLSVVRGGPADAAGVRVGDRIVALGGRSVAGSGLGLDDARPYTTGAHPYTLTIAAAGSAPRTVTIRPRDLLPR